MTEIPPDTITVTALPPHDKSSMAFRAAVYTDPHAVFLEFTDGEDINQMRVSDMLSGTCFLVRNGKSTWLVLLSRTESSRYHVADGPPRPSPQAEVLYW